MSDAAVLDAPPPPAPSPAPAAPAPAVPEAPAPAPSPGDDNYDPLAGLEALAKDDGTGPDPKPRGDDGRFKAADKPADKSKPGDGNQQSKPDADNKRDDKQQPEPEKKEKAGQLRILKEAAEAENKSLKAEIERLKTAKPPEDPEKRRITEEHKSTLQKLADAEKRLEEYEGKLALADYQETKEFKEKFHKPYVDAWIEGRALAGELTVVERKNPETGEVIQQARPGEAKDFDAIMGAPDRGKAGQIARQLFGEDAVEIITASREVRNLSAARIKAIEDNRANAAQHIKNQGEQMRRMTEEATNFFETQAREGIEGHPEWFKPDESDPKGNQILEEGMHLARRAFRGGMPLREGDKPLTPQQTLKLQAAIMNQAGGFRRMAYLLAKEKEKNATLAKDLEEFESSRGTRGTAGSAKKGAGAVADDDTADSAFGTAFSGS